MKKGQTVIHDPALKRLRALAMMRSRIHGASYADLAKEFNVSKETVQRVLSWANKAGLVVKAEDEILESLVPEALKTITKVLTKSEPSAKDAAIAVRVLQGALPGFAGKQVAPRVAGTEGDEEGDLYTYIDRIRKAMEIDGQATGVTELVEAKPQGLIEAGSQGDAPQGVSTSVEGDGSGVTTLDSTRGEPQCDS